ncbi:MAG: hypothetical protein RL026_702 [Pseudomonadota bacterium]|jgi:predicted permease
MPVQIQVACLLLLFAAGMLARRRGWLGPPQAGRLLQLVIYVGLPALLLADVSKVPLRADLALLPLTAASLMALQLGVAWWLGRQLGLPTASRGAFIICSMSINAGFLFPFVIAAWGPEAVARLALFDIGNSLMQGSVLYVVGALHGGHATDAGSLARRVLGFPPLWAVLAALAMNLAGWAWWPEVGAVLGWTGRLILLLVVLAMGVMFDLKLLRAARVLWPVVIRIGLGAAVGAAVVTAFGLSGATASVLLLACAAPIGFTVLAVANRENLDREAAASAASLSVLLGLAYVPLALWWLAPAGT